MIVKNIKAFLKEKGLNWTGDILTHRREDFSPATKEDFKYLNKADFLISFGKEGEIALSIEVDLINFRIYGESFDVALNAYAGDNEKNKKLCRERDLSKEWVKFQLKSSGLIYAAALRIRCAEDREKAEEDCEQKVKQLDRKIQYLEKSKEKVKENKMKKLKEIKGLEKLADSVENF